MVQLPDMYLIPHLCWGLRSGWSNCQTCTSYPTFVGVYGQDGPTARHVPHTPPLLGSTVRMAQLSDMYLIPRLCWGLRSGWSNCQTCTSYPAFVGVYGQDGPTVRHVPHTPPLLGSTVRMVQLSDMYLIPHLCWGPRSGWSNCQTCTSYPTFVGVYGQDGPTVRHVPHTPPLLWSTARMVQLSDMYLIPHLCWGPWSGWPNCQTCTSYPTFVGVYGQDGPTVRHVPHTPPLLGSTVRMVQLSDMYLIPCLCWGLRSGWSNCQTCTSYPTFVGVYGQDGPTVRHVPHTPPLLGSTVRMVQLSDMYLIPRLCWGLRSGWSNCQTCTSYPTFVGVYGQDGPTVRHVPHTPPLLGSTVRMVQLSDMYLIPHLCCGLRSGWSNCQTCTSYPTFVVVYGQDGPTVRHVPHTPPLLGSMVRMVQLSDMYLIPRLCWGLRSGWSNCQTCTSYPAFVGVHGKDGPTVRHVPHTPPLLGSMVRMVQLSDMYLIPHLCWGPWSGWSNCQTCTSYPAFVGVYGQDGPTVRHVRHTPPLLGSTARMVQLSDMYLIPHLCWGLRSGWSNCQTCTSYPTFVGVLRPGWSNCQTCTSYPTFVGVYGQDGPTVRHVPHTPPLLGSTVRMVQLSDMYLIPRLCWGLRSGWSNCQTCTSYHAFVGVLRPGWSNCQTCTSYPTFVGVLRPGWSNCQTCTSYPAFVGVYGQDGPTVRHVPHTPPLLGSTARMVQLSDMYLIPRLCWGLRPGWSNCQTCTSYPTFVVVYGQDGPTVRHVPHTPPLLGSTARMVQLSDMYLIPHLCWGLRSGWSNCQTCTSYPAFVGVYGQDGPTVRHVPHTPPLLGSTVRMVQLSDMYLIPRLCWGLRSGWSNCQTCTSYPAFVGVYGQDGPTVRHVPHTPPLLWSTVRMVQLSDMYLIPHLCWGPRSGWSNCQTCTSYPTFVGVYGQDGPTVRHVPHTPPLLGSTARMVQLSDMYLIPHLCWGLRSGWSNCQTCTSYPTFVVVYGQDGPTVRHVPHTPPLLGSTVRMVQLSDMYLIPRLCWGLRSGWSNCQTCTSYPAFVGVYGQDGPTVRHVPHTPPLLGATVRMVQLSDMYLIPRLCWGLRSGWSNCQTCTSYPTFVVVYGQDGPTVRHVPHTPPLLGSTARMVQLSDMYLIPHLCWGLRSGWSNCQTCTSYPTFVVVYGQDGPTVRHVPHTPPLLGSTVRMVQLSDMYLIPHLCWGLRPGWSNCQTCTSYPAFVGVHGKQPKE